MEPANERLLLQELPERVKQTCPLCGARQVTMMRGISADMETGELFIARDRGYSFCNCRNIFFTNYKNIDKTIYDEKYVAKYESFNIDKVSKINIDKFWDKLISFSPEAKTILELGSVNDIVLDLAKLKGLKTTGLDIIQRESKHSFICADLDNADLFSFVPKQDIVYAAHVVEHLKDPSRFLRQCRSIMHKDSVLHISMPDTFFINWAKPETFDWVVSEHYILWNMKDFVKFAEEHGLKCIYSRRGIDMFKQDANWHWLQEFKAVFKLC